MATKTLTLVIELPVQGEMSDEDYQEWGNEIIDKVNEEAYVASVQWGERA